MTIGKKIQLSLPLAFGLKKDLNWSIKESVFFAFASTNSIERDIERYSEYISKYYGEVSNET